MSKNRGNHGGDVETNGGADEQVLQETQQVEAEGEVQNTEPEVQEPQDEVPVVAVKMNIGAFARHLLLNSKLSNTDILARVHKVFPGSKTTAACIAWYKSDLRKKGVVFGAVKKTEVELTPEQLEELMK